jgi:hypothetical protein
VYRKDVLTFAYECCKANGGAGGVDNQTFEDVEAYGTERWLDELTQELKSRTYRPLPVRMVFIPKPDGKARPLAALWRALMDAGYEVTLLADGGTLSARARRRHSLKGAVGQNISSVVSGKNSLKATGEAMAKTPTSPLSSANRR